MPLKSSGLEEPRIDLTPMLDCVMLLIIFFMVGTQFTNQERQYDVQLPVASDATALTGLPDEIVVNVLKDGRFFVKGEARTTAEIEAMLRVACENFPGQSVVIRGDGEGRYQLVIDAMSACRRAGVRSIQLANQPAASEG